MAHYYRTRRPLSANAVQMHRVCRCTTDANRNACDQVLREFFVLEDGVYRHHRIDQELAKAIGISEVRRAAAHEKHRKRTDANAVQMQSKRSANATQSQSQSQSQLELQSQESKALCTDVQQRHPTIEQVSQYCRDRKNEIDPQRFIDHYSANGWKVGRNPMKDWRAAVRTWEKNGVNANGSEQHNSKAEQRLNRQLAAIRSD